MDELKDVAAFIISPEAPSEPGSKSPSIDTNWLEETLERLKGESAIIAAESGPVMVWADIGNRPILEMVTAAKGYSITAVFRLESATKVNAQTKA